MTQTIGHPINTERDPLIRKENEVSISYWRSHRYNRIVLIGFFGFFNVYALRVCLSVAVQPMKDEFKWTSTEEGIVLSSFFAGYIFTQLPGGFLATKVGGKWVLGFGVLGTAVLTLLTPIATKLSIWALVAVRVLEGVGEGVTFPAMHALFAKWAPPKERSRMTTLTYGGSYVGTVVAFPVAGSLAGSDFLGGWPSVFYVFGALGIVWFAIWAVFAHNSPEDDPSISPEERAYIMSKLEAKQDKLKVPWLKLFTNLPVWALIINHLCNNWAFYTLLTWLPTYFSDVLKFNIKDAGVISFLPYLGIWLVSLTGGFIADILIKSNKLSVTAVRKLFETLAFVIAGVALISLGYINNITVAVTVMTVAISASGFSNVGYNVNHLDIATEYAGVLMGISNTAATIPGIVSPTLTGMILGEEHGISQWREVFFISGGFYAFGLLVWLAFASGKKQF